MRRGAVGAAAVKGRAAAHPAVAEGRAPAGVGRAVGVDRAAGAGTAAVAAVDRVAGAGTVAAGTAELARRSLARRQLERRCLARRVSPGLARGALGRRRKLGLVRRLVGTERRHRLWTPGVLGMALFRFGVVDPFYRVCGPGPGVDADPVTRGPGPRNLLVLLHRTGRVFPLCPELWQGLDSGAAAERDAFAVGPDAAVTAHFSRGER